MKISFVCLLFLSVLIGLCAGCGGTYGSNSSAGGGSSSATTPTVNLVSVTLSGTVNESSIVTVDGIKPTTTTANWSQEVMLDGVHLPADAVSPSLQGNIVVQAVDASNNTASVTLPVIINP